MEKRLTFQCWQCQRTYSLLRKWSATLKSVVECPFCGAEAIADLAPYRSPTVEVFKGGEAELETLNLPEVLPTRPIEA